MGLAMRQPQDSDKLKADSARSLGNALRYIPAKSVGKIIIGMHQGQRLYGPCHETTAR